MLRKKEKKHVGKIFAVNAKHVINKNEWSDYKKTKGSKAKNKRLVMVASEKENDIVKIAKMTTKASEEKIKKGLKVRLSKTYPKKKSFVDTDSISKSKLTNKRFKVGETPLTKVQKNVHPDDLSQYQRARKKRSKKNSP